MSQAWKTHHDYIVFFYGLAFVVLAATSFGLSRKRQTRLPWSWLGYFGLLYGIGQWMEMVTTTTGDSPSFDALRALTLVLAMVALFEFGRAGVTRKGLPRWLIIPLLLAAGLASQVHSIGPDRAVCYSLTLAAGLVSAASLIIAAIAGRGTERRWLWASGGLIGLHTCLLVIVAPTARAFASLVSDDRSIMGISHSSAHLILALIGVGIAVSLAAYAETSDDSDLRVGRRRLSIGAWRSLALLALVAIGWPVTDRVGKAADELCRHNLLMRSISAASAIEPAEVAKLTASSADLTFPEYRHLRAQLRNIRVANTDCRFVYLMGMKNGGVVFLADAEPETSQDYSAPGDPYDEASPELRHLLAGGPAFVEGPASDEWGTWVSGLAPVGRANSDSPAVVIGMDINAADWQHIVATYRLVSITVILLLCGLTLAYFMAFERARHAHTAVAASENRYRGLVENSPNWVALLDDNGKCLSVNRTGFNLLGDLAEEMVGGTFADIWPQEFRATIAQAFCDALGGARKSVEAELTTLRGQTSWHVTLGPIVEHDGSIERVVAIGANITEHRRAEQALRESEEKHRNVVERASDGIAIIQDGLVKYVNQRLADMVDRSREELADAAVSFLVHPDALSQVVERYTRRLAGDEVVAIYESALQRKDGSKIEVEINAGLVNYEGRSADLIIMRDITLRKTAEEKLRIHTSAMSAASDQIFIADADGMIEFVNPSFERETGYSSEEIVGKSINILKCERQDDSFYDDLWHTVCSGRPWKGEITTERKNASFCTEDMTITPVKNDCGEIERFVGIKRDISEKKSYEKQLDRMAHHDHLTGLPNRLLFADRLNQSLSRARRKSAPLAVMFLDLDRFKTINDTLGHSTGDLLLKSVAERVSDCIREADTVARMGGDEFTVILTESQNQADVLAVAQRILDSLAEPFDVAGHELFVTTSIGISIYPSDGVDVETLVRNADAAMYRAKEQGRNNYQLCSWAVNAAALEKFELETALRRAVERNEFLAHYQPRVNLHTGEIVGLEALVRWQHPELGLISPAQFIPIAEETGLIVPIGEWVVKEACEQNKRWQDSGLPKIPVAVNISPRQFRHDDLVESIAAILEETRLAPEYLELEVTENAIMHRPIVAANSLRRLKEMGIRISIDDFGTGQSSLSYLKRFPLDTIKIDQSFVKDITTDPDDSAIAQAIISMAQTLGLGVIAEGVETLEQLELLKSLGCNEVQGYFISRPMRPEGVATALAENRDGMREGFLPAA